MKRAIICGICLKPARYSDSYAVRLLNYNPDKMTTSFQMDVSMPILKPAWAQIRVCLTCAKEIGYATKKTRVSRKAIDNPSVIS